MCYMYRYMCVIVWCACVFFHSHGIVSMKNKDGSLLECSSLLPDTYQFLKKRGPEVETAEGVPPRGYFFILSINHLNRLLN